MRDVLILFVHLIDTVIRMTRPGGARSIAAESVLLKHQLLSVKRKYRELFSPKRKRSLPGPKDPSAALKGNTR
jgi:hypothetical protein